MMPPVSAAGRAHPHVCGEHAKGHHWHAREKGSSPRMRGTPSSPWACRSLAGLIPTYAGNTTHSGRAHHSAWAHPHVCGEHVSDKVEKFSQEGSSPRMRGTRMLFTEKIISTGLIPTYAGNTCGRSRVAGSSRAHPHVCGEHFTLSLPCMTRWGSSPRMRGTLHSTFAAEIAGGLIPTYAGNTNQSMTFCLLSGAHPHVCGEHSRVTVGRTHGMGSSPRMRGTRRCRCSRCACWGLIPTYAGNTRYSPRR